MVVYARANEWHSFGTNVLASSMNVDGTGVLLLRVPVNTMWMRNRLLGEKTFVVVFPIGTVTSVIDYLLEWNGTTITTTTKHHDDDE